MFIITLILSAIILAFGSITRQRVRNNQRIAFERAVLEALAIDLTGRISPSGIHEVYTEKIADPTASTASALRYLENDSLIGYALPIGGPGFWAPIRGAIGIAADTQTVTGISFYEQNETPGLGGEIIKNEFTDQFIGKRLADTDPPLEIRAVSAELDQSSVHAITGATQTSTRLARFMNEQLAAWRRAMKGTQ
jgi:Na+-transporting NADH:ubiquinone oxidoreductase subunit C